MQQSISGEVQRVAAAEILETTTDSLFREPIICLLTFDLFSLLFRMYRLALGQREWTSSADGGSSRRGATVVLGHFSPTIR